MKHYPVTIAIVALSVLTAIFPGLASVLELDFQLAQQGEVWRWLTGHVTHFDFQHFFWDCSMFAVLSAICESRYRGGYAMVLLPCMLAVSITLSLACPQIACYRGLSGIDTTLFVWLAIDWVWATMRRGEWVSSAVAGIGIVCLLGKLGYEAYSGQTLFVQADSFQPLVEAHIAGAICGMVGPLCANASSSVRFTMS